ncbi:aminopeptidase P family protein [[Clostridium] spiroforme]|nr:aminopeptidase P family protein [Thomasclavelia spiroformis]
MINSKIRKLRKLMQEKNIDAYIIPTNDYHSSEYVGNYFKCREFMSGFTGSAGTLIVTANEACLWVDGRYFIQAENETANSEIKIMKMAMPNVPTISEYLQAFSNKIIGFDGKVIPYLEALQYGSHIAASDDLVNMIWTDRPAMSKQKAFLFDECYCGESRASKLQRIRKEMQGAKYHLVSSLDDIAWIFNIRGNDVSATPVVLAYALIEQEKAWLYIQKEVLAPDMIETLKQDQIYIKDYFDIYQDIQTIKETVLLDGTTINYALASQLDPKQIINAVNPSQMMKAIKNETEIKATKNAHLKDGIAVTKFMYWLKQTIGHEPLDEMSVADKLLQFRQQQELFTDISFTTICAYGANAALMHYHPTKQQHAKIEAKGLLLIDSGGQYLDGTTDITRTFVLGPLSDKEKRDFTIALKAMFRLQNAHFIKGVTTGENLDILARGVLYDYDLDYRCGTGHGVGHFLSVHEGPNGLRPKARSVNAPILPGMITTDEPGVYNEGEYGIRHENELLCVEGNSNEYGTFLHFEPITYVPFDLEGINDEYLSDKEIQSINDYQKMVYHKLENYLTDKEKQWYLNHLIIK